MSLIIVISLVIRTAAAAWSVVLWRRMRDWRMGFLTFMILFMVARQTWTLIAAVREEGTWSISLGGHLHELPGVGTSIVSCLAVVFLGNMLEERRRAEATLRESEERFRDMGDAAPVMIWTAGPDRQITWFNKGWLAFTGRPLGREIGTGWADGLHPDDRDATVRGYQEAFDQRRPFTLEYRLMRHDGAYRWIVETANPRFTVDGRFTGYIGVCVDITVRKAAEEAMRVSEERFRLIAGATNDAVWDWDLNTDQVWWNEGLQTLFGYDPADVELTAGWWKAQIHPDDREQVVNGIHAVIEGDGRHWQCEYRFRRGDGGYVHVFDRGSVIREENDEPIRMVGAMLDLTQRKEAEEAVRRAQEELLRREHRERELVEAELANVREELIQQTRLATLGQLAASIAHELRNPLGSIRNAAYFLQGEIGGNDPTLRKHLRIIDEEVNTADRIIGDLLEMSRGKEPSRHDVQLGEILRTVRERINLPDGIAYELDVSPPDLRVRVDDAQMSQVLANLVTNALQAIDGPGRITVTARCSAEHDEIVVHDTGPGVPPEDRDRIFEPLYSTKTKGTGLGLAICRQIVERHGGTLDLVPTVEAGAAFRIRLPRQHSRRATAHDADVLDPDRG